MQVVVIFNVYISVMGYLFYKVRISVLGEVHFCVSTFFFLVTCTEMLSDSVYIQL